MYTYLLNNRPKRLRTLHPRPNESNPRRLKTSIQRTNVEFLRSGDMMFLELLFPGIVRGLRLGFAHFCETGVDPVAGAVAGEEGVMFLFFFYFIIINDEGLWWRGGV